MARSSWTAIYTDVEQRFMRARRYKLFFLLKAIVQHTDAFGLSYPGDDLLQELTGIGSQRLLNEALQFLVDGEYIKVWETWNPRRRGYERDFQVSPVVMYIRDDLLPYCITLWNTGDRDFELEKSIVMKLNGQPESESNKESESLSRISTHHQHPPKSALTETDKSTTKSTDKTKQRRRREQGKARSTEKDNPQAGRAEPPIPSKVDLRKYQSPLRNIDDEQRAQDLSLSLRMKISQARSLVALYGQELVGVAARAVAEAMTAGRSTNPPGLLTSLLKTGRISLEDRKIYKTREEEIREANEEMGFNQDDLSE